MSEEVRTVRRFRDLLEPLAACVYFAPEAHQSFVELGFGPPGPERAGITGPNIEAYFTSRGACLGQVDGEVMAAAFGVFAPALVVPAVTAGWQIAPRDQVLAAREQGAVAFLERAVELEPEHIIRLTELLVRAGTGCETAGRALSSGLRSLGMPGTLWGDLWRAADVVREHRGDGHIMAWAAAGLSAPEIMLLTELWWGVPRRSYALTRGWSREQFDQADERLAARGWVSEDRLTDQGRELRRRIELVTDQLETGVHRALGHHVSEAIELLEPISEAILEAGGYPRQAFQTVADMVRGEG